MKVIDKYRFLATDYFDINIPPSAQILSCKVVDGEPVIYALVDLEKNLNGHKRFYVFTTDNKIEHRVIDQELTYVDSFSLYKDKFIGHLFELTGELK